ncbi:MAG: hypothetical protein HQK77_02830 [Desulfobacterales bacterium]|nr:hypothetical protein [Desulfobacterales bacterium]
MNLPKKHFFSLVIASVLLAIPCVSMALTISDLVNKPVPSPIVVASGTFMPMENIIFVDWKIANITRELPDVDIYLFIKQMEAAVDNEFAEIPDINSDDTEPTLISASPNATYYVVLDLTGILLGKDLMSCITAVPDQEELLEDVSLIDYASEQGDIFIPGFPVNVSKIPISNGKYVIGLALANSKTGDIVAYSLDVIRMERQWLPPDNPKCDFNYDGIIDEFEKKNCHCDFNGDGAVDEEESENCGTRPMPCDANQDGMIDEEEKMNCAYMPSLPCDTNKDGMIDEEEAMDCANIPELPCDTNKDGMIDGEEAINCRPDMPTLPCDADEDGFIDVEEAINCELPDMNDDNNSHTTPM